MRLGAKIVGGCCGTTPDHIKAMREKLDNYIESSKSSFNQTTQDLNQNSISTSLSSTAYTDSKEDESIDQSTTELSSKLSLTERLNQIKDDKDKSQFFVSVEIDPPKGAVTKNF